MSQNIKIFFYQVYCNAKILLTRGGAVENLTTLVTILSISQEGSPEAAGRRGRMVLPPISKDEDGIPQYVRARLTVFTLLFNKLKPAIKSIIILFFCECL